MATLSDRTAALMQPAFRRLARRRTQRGAAIFIVVMAIVLLTGIGIFAVRTASMVDVAAGYERQATQTHHLSEYAGRIAASHASGSKTVFVMGLIGAPKESIAFQQSDLSERVLRDSSNPLFVAPAATVAGSYGPPIPTELVNHSPVPEARMKLFYSDANFLEATPGEEVGKDPPLEVTITAMAQMRPTPEESDPWCTSADSAGAATVQSLRSHITIVK